MSNPIDAVAVVLASGSGQRFGSKVIPKHLNPLLGVPVMVWTLRTALESDLFSAITVVTRKQDMADARRIINEYFPSRKIVIHVVEGASDRMDSFLNGFNGLNSQGVVQDETCVALMDANRPFASIDQLQSLLEAASTVGCSCPARQVINGVAKVESGRIAEVPNKAEYVEFVTPEFMQAGMLRSSLDQFGTSKVCLVECSLGIGVQPVIIESSPLNVKLTYPEDAKYLEGLAKEHEITTPQVA